MGRRPIAISGENCEVPLREHMDPLFTSQNPLNTKRSGNLWEPDPHTLVLGQIDVARRNGSGFRSWFCHPDPLEALASDLEPHFSSISTVPYPLEPEWGDGHSVAVAAQTAVLRPVSGSYLTLQRRDH